MSKTTRPATRGELKVSGWKSRSVKDELRDNLRARIESGEPVFPGIVGYDKTVLPGIENALLARHNFILLGLRGQAKSRIVRGLETLLDEYIPVIPGSLLNEDPLSPISPRGRQMVAEMGDRMPIAWLHRSERYHEKLATPDVSIADLIGDIDPIKAAREKLDISNEEVIHWGIIPRTNRGIFAINELPDLQPRIQVGLLNILEEKDIQFRGFPLRVPLDMLLVFTANPEDYTNRGNIITPLKDRIDAQIITHYPRTLAEARAITEHEADIAAADIRIPDLVRDLIEEVSFQARASEFVDQTSGVSARVSIAAYEALVSNIERRVLRFRDQDRFPRMADVYAIIPAVTGKIELVYEGEREGSALVAHNLIGLAVKEVFARHFPEPRRERRRGDQSSAADRENPYEAITDYFSSGRKLELSDDMPFDRYKKALTSIAGLDRIVRRYFDTRDEREFLLRMELVLEGLHQYNVIAREIRDSAVSYGDVLSDMLRGMESDR
ncbi:MAG TPA: magnesium chelatase [candidate division Zixibacteria bacterium]|nr:magnesium chelatase [candidate division Zixibacteria bacterium]